MYPHSRQFAQIHLETRYGAEVLSCVAYIHEPKWREMLENLFTARCSAPRRWLCFNLSAYDVGMSSMEGYKHPDRLLAGSHCHTSCYRLQSRADGVR